MVSKFRWVCAPVAARSTNRLGAVSALIPLLFALAFFGCKRNQDPPPQSSRLPHYELRMAAQDLEALEREPFSNATHPATFIASGKKYERVKVRVRGSWSR